MVFDFWQGKLCDGFFVLQVRSYTINGNANQSDCPLVIPVDQLVKHTLPQI